MERVESAQAAHPSRTVRPGGVVRRAWPGLLVILSLSGCTMPEPIAVMSFNIRYANAADGPNRWELRRELALRVIRDADADVIGFQEVLASQLDDLAAALPEYQHVGAGRDDGVRAGEAVPIFFRRQRFDLVEGSHFWLSDDPHTIGTIGWDAALPRMATWVRLRFRNRPWIEVYVLNTHFDHRGARARLESAKLLSRTIESLGGLPIVLMGDFNCGPGAPPHQALLNAPSTSGALRDSFVAATGEPPPSGAASAGGRAHGTYHGFDGAPDTPRIDWILHNRRFHAEQAAIVRTHAAGRYPSDHFPVTATLRLLPATDLGGM